MEFHYVALIPAKGTSTGIPGKNLQVVGSKSLLARCIEGALSLSMRGDVVVSTDDKEIAQESERLGALVHWRDASAATAEATAAQVIFDFLQSTYGSSLRGEDYLLYLQPTSPFRSAVHIDAALSLLKEEGGVGVVSVCPVRQFPEKMVLKTGKIVEPQDGFPPGYGVNRQLLPERYYPNGAIYGFRVDAFRALGEVPIEGCLVFKMDSITSIDIDSADDLMTARAIADYAGI